MFIEHQVHIEKKTIADVEDSVAKDDGLSIRCHAQKIGLCPSTLWKILSKELGLLAYKIQLVHEV